MTSDVQKCLRYSYMIDDIFEIQILTYLCEAVIAWGQYLTVNATVVGSIPTLGNELFSHATFSSRLLICNSLKIE